MPSGSSTTDSDQDNLGPQVLQAFKALSEADKSVILAGAQHPGSTMLTTKGSANDRFWTLLSQADWTEEVALPEGIQDTEMARQSIAWAVTSLGAVALPVLFRKARE